MLWRTKKRDAREEYRARLASLPDDPSAAVHVERKVDAYCKFVNDQLGQIFGDLTAIADHRASYIDEQHSILVNATLFPTKIDFNRYSELLQDLQRHSKSLSENSRSLRVQLPSVARIRSPASLRSLAKALDKIDYLVQRMMQLDSLFPVEGLRLLKDATEAFEIIDTDNEAGGNSDVAEH